MSIIYDALQKTQKNREVKFNSNNSQMQKNEIRTKIFLIVLSASLVASIFFFYIKFYVPQTLASASVHPQKHEVVTSTKTAENIPLNVQGVFDSNKSKIIMVNNSMYQVGDKIDDMEIISITKKMVKLRKGNKIVLLPLDF